MLGVWLKDLEQFGDGGIDDQGLTASPHQPSMLLARLLKVGRSSKSGMVYTFAALTDSRGASVSKDIGCRYRGSNGGTRHRD
jgi:hypothetical protein